MRAAAQNHFISSVDARRLSRRRSFPGSLRMELYQIRYFLAVADTLNFTRASERSFVSQPALTKAIQRLEDTIGGRLFDRAKNAVQLTELGRAMLPNFRQIYESANHAREEARRLTREQKEVVRVGVMCTAQTFCCHDAVQRRVRAGQRRRPPIQRPREQRDGGAAPRALSRTCDVRVLDRHRARAAR